MQQNLSKSISLLVAIAALSGCGNSASSLRNAPPAPIAEQLNAESPRPEAASERVDGSVDAYVGIALANRPALTAHAQRWRAATFRADAATAWPRIQLTYAFLPLPVETRLGPQRHRIGLRQGIPWPGQLDAAFEAASAEASIEEIQLAATATAIRERVELAYWDLWALRKTGQILSEQNTVLETSARIARGGAEVGNQGFSSVARIELVAARLRDQQASNSAKIAAAEARFRGALGLDPGPIPTNPGAWVGGKLADPDVTEAPELRAMRRKVEASARAADAAQASARPTFSVGVDYIVVTEGEAMSDDAGRDALMLMLGITLPTTWSAEGARADSARASGAAIELETADALITRSAQANALIALARDSQRQFEFCRDTLLPQAETTFEASLGDYESGRATVADLLLAQREWLELSLRAVNARADYQRAVAQLARLVGTTFSNRGGLDE